MLAKAFDHYCQSVGYEKSLPKIRNWIDNENPNIKRAVIDNEEYFEVKKECKDQIEKLEKKLTKVEDKKKIDFPKLLDRALSNLINLDKVFTAGDIEVKRKIIGSIFPEKL